MLVKDASSEDAKARGVKARIHLGSALHTLQDFYAHSNWAELGFGGDEIDIRLGREHIPNAKDFTPDPTVGNIPNPKKRRDTSEPVSEEELLARAVAIVKAGLDPESPALPEEALLRYAKTNLAQFRDEIEASVSAKSAKPGILKPEFRDGSRDKTKLTTGYFMGNGPVESCRVPTGKTRHGAFLPILLINCPDGLNKDDDTRPGYPVARAQAVKASKDYIHQIIFEDPIISKNTEAIKALMGIGDPCKAEDSQNREECKLKSGKSYGDPHLATFDGSKYSFQTVGEFILVKSNRGNFEIQTRQAPVRSALSLNSAVAMKIGSNRIAFYAKDFPDADTSNPLRINGKPATMAEDKLALADGSTILKKGKLYVVSSPAGEKVTIAPISVSSNSYLNVSPFVYNQAGRYSGLLGNVNGNPNDDQQIRGKENSLEIKSTYGDVKQVLNQVGLRLPGALDVAEKLYFDQLYKEFGNSWRVRQEESLFDYPTGKTTKNYTDPAFPDQYLKLDMLSTQQIQNARNACTEAQVTEDLMEGCIFDVGFSGWSDFARATAEVNGYIGIVNQVFPGLNIPTPEQAVERVIDQVKPKVCLPFVGCV